MPQPWVRVCTHSLGDPPRIAALNTILVLTTPALTLQPRPLPSVPASPNCPWTSLLGLSVLSSLARRSGAQSLPLAPVSLVFLSLFFLRHWPPQSSVCLGQTLRHPLVSQNHIRPWTNLLAPPPDVLRIHLLSPPPLRLPCPSCRLPGSWDSLPASLWLLTFAHYGLVSEYPGSLSNTQVLSW